MFVEFSPADPLLLLTNLVCPEMSIFTLTAEEKGKMQQFSFIFSIADKQVIEKLKDAVPN